MHQGRSRLPGPTAADRTLGIAPAIYFLGDSKITDRASANLNQAMRVLDSAGRVARPRALSTSKVSIPATAMADKLITSWITEPIASLGTQ